MSDLNDVLKKGPARFSSDGKVGSAGDLPAGSAFGKLGDAQLDALLASVHALYPIASMWAEEGGVGFRFKSPVSWPLFALLDIAKPFQPQAAAWAGRARSREVRAFGFGGGAMFVEAG